MQKGFTLKVGFSQQKNQTKMCEPCFSLVKCYKCSLYKKSCSFPDRGSNFETDNEEITRLSPFMHQSRCSYNCLTKLKTKGTKGQIVFVLFFELLMNLHTENHLYSKKK